MAPGRRLPRRRALMTLALAAGAAAAVALAVVLAVVLGVHLLAGGQAHPPRAAALRPGIGALSPAGGPPPAPAGGLPAVGPAPGRLGTVHFYSPALHRRADYLVYLPAGYSASRRLPVFYLLHGMPGRPLAFTANAQIEPKLERLIRLRRIAPMILVFPDGRIDGRNATDSEWANTPSGAFESYVVDVVHDVDDRFATLRRRQDRAIAGLSAGAYGAINVGLHQVALFGLIQVWSGYFTETHDGVFAHADRAQMTYNSPIDYVQTMRRTLRRQPLRIFLYVGARDGNRAQTPPMAAALRAEGAEVRYAIYPGGHSWGLWSPRIDQMLIMAAHDFEHPLVGDEGRPVARGATRSG